MAIDARSSNGSWTTLGGAAVAAAGYTPHTAAPSNTGLHVDEAPVPRSGVTYPGGTGDQAIGTRIDGFPTAQWKYTATLSRTASQLTTLLNISDTTQVRVRIHMEGRRVGLFGITTDVNHDQIATIAQMVRSQSGSATNVVASLRASGQATQVFNSSSSPSLSAIAAGEQVVIPTTVKIPAITGKGATETDAAYRTRLQAALEASVAVSADVSYISRGLASPIPLWPLPDLDPPYLLGPSRTASASATPAAIGTALPIMGVAKTGPTDTAPGESATYRITATNSGNALGSASVTDDVASIGSSSVAGFGALAAGSSLAADHSVTIPADFPGASVTDKASVVWTDAAGNSYGPLSTTVSTPIRVDTTPPDAPTITTKPSALSASRSATFTFTGESGSRFDCNIDSGTTASCTVPVVYASLPDGNHIFSVRQTDAAGNAGSWSSYAWAIDASAPDAPEITSHPDVLTSATTADFDFGGEPGATFECSLDGVGPAACSSPVHLAGVTPGMHQFSVTQSDLIGNQGPPTTFEWQVDTIAPESPILASTPQAVTSDSTAGFGFTGEAGGHFECSLDESAFTTCANPRSYPTLSEGSHVFRARQVDGAGNVGSAAPFSWRIDLTAPEAPNVTSQPPASTSSRSATVEFETEPDASAQCSLDGEQYASCSSPFTTTNLPDGNHVFSVRQVDAAANVGPARSLEWNVSSDAPVAPRIVEHQDALASWNFAGFLIEFDEGNTGECQLDDAPYAECDTQPFYEGLNEGDHVFRVRQRNYAGDVSPAATFEWRTDYTQPEPPVFTYVTDSDFIGDEIVVSWLPSEDGHMRCVDGGGGDWQDCESPFVLSNLAPGDYYMNFSWEDAAGNQGYYDFKHWSIHAPVLPDPPTITGAPSGVLATNAGAIEFTLPDETSAECAVDEGDFLPCESPFATENLGDGQHVVSIRSVDVRAFRSSVVSAAWTVDTTPPVAPTFVDGPEGDWAFTSATLKFDGEPGAKFSCHIDDAPFKSCTSPKHFGLLELGAHSFSVRQLDVAGNVSAVATRTWTNTVSPESAEPEAPPLEENGVAPFKDQVSFLYDGPEAIQDVPDPEIFTAQRVSIVRGTVTDTTGDPVAGVRVSVVDHPEFGVTQSRDTGEVYLAVNGGGNMTIRFELNGASTVDRKVNVPWRDYAFFDDVVITPLDTMVSEVSLDSPGADGEIAEGSTVADEDGVRKLGVVFPAGVTAQMAMPDGSLTPISDLDVRLTEYTVGETGPDAMPAPLPATSGYTYAADLSVDQALAAGATGVKFSEPVYAVVDNFRQIPEGTIMPQGFYDREKTAWTPEPNGKVMKVLAIDDGKASFDDGNGSAIPAPGQGDFGDNAWNEIVSYAAERFEVGDTFWLVPMNHFSAVDINVPGGGNGVIPPELNGGGGGTVNNPCIETRSIIECENQTLGESIDIPGTDMSLNYRSDRAPGRTAKQGVDIPLTGDSVPNDLEHVELSVQIGGKQLVRRFPAEPNQSFRFDWDGLDWAGRRLIGTQKAEISVGYAFPGYMYAPAITDEDTPAWATLGAGEPIVGPNGGIKFHTSRGSTVELQAPAASGSRLMEEEDVGGWSVSTHNRLDPLAQTTIRGDGAPAGPEPSDVAVTRVAGIPYTEWPQDGCDDDCGNATLVDPGQGIPVASVGLSGLMRSVLRLPPIAAVGAPDSNDPAGIGDGGPAQEAQIARGNIAMAPDGSTVFYQGESNRIRRIDHGGTITTIAGTGEHGDSGDGGLAADAQIDDVRAIAIDGLGSIYFSQGFVVRKIDPAGIITRYAGDGHDSDGTIPVVSPDYRDDGPALEARLGVVHGLAVNPTDGLLYMTGDPYLARRVEADGTITSIGNASRGPGHGIDITTSITVNSEGTVYVNAQNSSSLTAIDPATFKRSEAMKLQIGSGIYGNGQITGLAVGKRDRLFLLASELGYGGISGVFAWDSQTGIKRVPWNETTGENPTSIATDVTGDLSLAGYDGIFRYGPALPDHLVAATSVPDRSGETVSLYDAYGRHRETRSTRTNGLLKSFEYSGGHRLKAIIDRFGNRTTIERDSQGDPTAIVAPFGQRTELTVGAGHLLSSVVKPGGAETSITYDSGGLMKTFSMPNGGTSRFTYDPDGRLKRDEDALGGHLDLAKSGSPDDFSVEISDGRGRLKTNRVERLTDGSTRRTIDSAKNGESTRVEGEDGSTTSSSPLGSSRVETAPDQRFGAAVRVPTSATATTPNGRSASTTETHSFDLETWWDPSSWSTESARVESGGQEWNSTYEKATNTYIQTAPSGRVLSAEFNEQMDPVRLHAAGLADAELGYDTAGRISSARAGDREATFQYDARGNLTTVTDPAGQSAHFGYDAADRVVTEELPGGRTIQYAYDAAGNVSSISPPSRPAHEALYDLLGRATSVKAPMLAGSVAETKYEYDGADNELTKATRPSGRTANISYDSAGRASGVSMDEGDHEFTYDQSSGQLTNATSPDGQSTDLSFDGNLLTSISQSGVTSGQVSLDYDSLFRPARVTAPGMSVPLTYDQDSMLSSAGEMTIQRSPVTGFISGTTVGNTSSSLAYSQYAEPSASASSFPNGGQFNETYVRDEIGRITEKTVQSAQGADQFAYAYDPASRLASVEKNGDVQETYTYDANSNRTATTYAGDAGAATIPATFDARDRMTTYGGLALSYNQDGELTQKQNTSTGDAATFTYSTLGALTGATLPGGRNITYASDAFGNRVAKRVDGQVEQAFLYAPGSLSPVAELGSSGDPVANFVYATRSTVPDYMVKNGHTYRLITDQIGSVKLVVDVESGSVEQAIDYDAFGRVLSDSSPGFQPFGFAGGLYDRDTKLTHFGAREYDAELGRWTSSDPISFAGGDTNLYGYVIQDPVNFVDPSGLYPISYPGKDQFEKASKWVGDAVRTVSPNFGEMCGQSYFERVWENTKKTNDHVIGLVAPPGFTLGTGGKVAELLGTSTLFKWAFTYPKRPPIWGPAGSAAVNFFAVSGSWIVGTGIGSLGTAGYICGCA